MTGYPKNPFELMTAVDLTKGPFADLDHLARVMERGEETLRAIRIAPKNMTLH
jgi:hypothetical protein